MKKRIKGLGLVIALSIIYQINSYGLDNSLFSLPKVILNTPYQKSQVQVFIAKVEEEKRIAGEKRLEEEKKREEEKRRIEEEKRKTITLSIAGDVTLGYYAGQNEWNRFDKVAEKEGYAYFLKNVLNIFKKDDLTIVNLEGPLTTGGKKVEKEFAMKGHPSYTQILLDGSVESVNLANNHTYDYGEEGYRQTKEGLDKAGIGYFGENQIQYVSIKDVRVALIGAKGWSAAKSVKDKLTNQIVEAKKKADLVIVMFHWGIEREFYPNKEQKDLAYHVIDAGADLVVGSHPHVIQGIEEYKGRNIIYSLGNFSFGGNRNPSDKDTFIYQETFKLTEKGIESLGSQIIPCRISSVKTVNNYQPTPLTGEEGNQVINRLKEYSKNFKISYFNK